MRAGIWVFVLLLIVGSNISCNKQSESNGHRAGTVVVPPDGEYLIIAMEADGLQRPEENFTQASAAARTVLLTGEKLSSATEHPDNVLLLQWDVSKNPGHVTVQAKTPGGRLETNHGIFKYEADILTICFGQGDSGEQSRPTEFKTTKGSKATMMTLKKR
jgi:uncharacterized protein (TIGR03067 family)